MGKIDSGVILDCYRCITGVSCTKVLHSFNEMQIFGNLFVMDFDVHVYQVKIVAHTIIEP